ncbi:hypothetical protein K2Z84_18650 [Candidatus Binatia bacterium]|nr:hypothetical protein [Candidatus Binatia bacterium]
MHETSGKFTRAKRPEQVADLEAIFEAIHWREFKILLKPQAFSDLERDARDYWKLAKRVARQVPAMIDENARWHTPQIREVTFFDTPRFDLYRRSYILRRRTPYRGDVPGEKFELTMKFRHPDPDLAWRTRIDFAEGLPGIVKFKEELLLVGTELGGMRSVFSHTCQIKNQTMKLGGTLGHWARIFPALVDSRIAKTAAIGPVNSTGIEEVLFDLGVIHFGGGRNAQVDLAVWRERETQRVLIGEFAFETSFKHYGRLHPRPKYRSERFYRLLQRETGAWVELGTTKTRLAYELSGKKLDHDE